MIVLEFATKTFFMGVAQPILTIGGQKMKEQKKMSATAVMAVVKKILGKVGPKSARRFLNSQGGTGCYPEAARVIFQAERAKAA